MGQRDAAWQNLEIYADSLRNRPLAKLFEADPHRFQTFSFELADLFIDVSKNWIDADALDRLSALAKACRYEDARDALFAGKAVNRSEGRAVFHWALRAPSGVSLPLAIENGRDVGPEIEAERERALTFADAIAEGKITAADGAPFHDILHIGVGGSDLGPSMVVDALAPYHRGPRCHFVANMDPSQVCDACTRLDASRTLVIVASKTFTTAETMANFDKARKWLIDGIGEAQFSSHLSAVTAAPGKAAEAGFPQDHTFRIWDWVGGRYSVWSSMGLAPMIALGRDRFKEFLSGAHAIDQHVREAPVECNAPLLLALLGVWYRNIWDLPTRAVVAYDERLSLFLPHLQQVDLESNGKSVRADGGAVHAKTAPVLWGGIGTTGQHAFFQLLHQGSDVVPVDFLLPAQPQDRADTEQHRKLVANGLAQSEALMSGRSETQTLQALMNAGHTREDAEHLAPHYTFPGNRPSTTILYKKLTPSVLGQLIALYEHRVFAESMLWGINAFDQPGVELGKRLATTMETILASGGSAPGTSSSSVGLVHTLRALGSQPNGR